MDNLYLKVKQLIAQHEDIVDFAEYGNGVSEQWLSKAEEALGLALPESYKWWLKNYGGGEVGGEEIFSIYEMDFDSVVGGDIVYMNQLDCTKSFYNERQILICASDVDGEFYFDKSNCSDGEEYPVFSTAIKSKYADNFLEFLIKRIEILSGESEY